MRAFSRKIFNRLLPFLIIIGPGIIAGTADNDAGGITSYSVAGANFGYSLLWVLFLTTFSLAITQEIGARMGLVTGKGLASLIREKFGIGWTTFIMAVLFIGNTGTIAAEFAGIGASMEILNVPRFFSIPIAAIAIYFLVTRGGFKTLERFFLAISVFYFAYLISAILVKPDWGAAMTGLVTPTINLDRDYLLMMMALIGTTITPWGQFFIQDYVVDKKLSKEDLKIERGDVFFGSFLTNFIAFFIIVTCAAALFTQGIRIENAKDAALALEPLAGEFSAILFAFGFLNASIFGAALVPFATSYVITEAFGFESGLNFKFREAPYFYGIFAVSLFLGAILVIFPHIPFIPILIITQTINAILLLPVFIFVYILSNDKKILNGYSNSRFMNIVVALTFAGVAIGAILYFIAVVFPNLF